MPTKRNPGTLGKTTQEELDLPCSVGHGSTDQRGDPAIPEVSTVDRRVIGFQVEPILSDMRSFIEYTKTHGTIDEMMALRDMLEGQSRLLTEHIWSLRGKK